MVIWITGLSASGKTTLAFAFKENYRNEHNNIVILDGDLVRDLFGNDLSYSAKDRLIQVSRVQKLALFLESQELIVIVTSLYSNDEFLDDNRKIFKDYFEIYLKSSVEHLLTREIKGLYRNALDAKINNVVGVDIPFIEPRTPFLIFDVSTNISVGEMCKIMYAKIFKNIN